MNDISRKSGRVFNILGTSKMADHANGVKWKHQKMVYIVIIIREAVFTFFQKLIDLVI